jgi:hypothetical protein
MRSKRAAAILSVLAVVLLAGRADVPAAPVAGTTMLPIAGTVDGLPESVSLAGSIRIVNTMIIDPILPTPLERLSLTLVKVGGVGLTSGAKYVATGENTIVRPLAATDQLEMTFPFYRSTPDGRMSARAAMATISLTFNLTTGAVSAAKATFSTPRKFVG